MNFHLIAGGPLATFCSLQGLATLVIDLSRTHETHSAGSVMPAFTLSGVDLNILAQVAGVFALFVSIEIFRFG